MVTLVCAVTAPAGTFTAHTQYNHYALLADDWLHGRLDLGGPPPAYAGFNDFAEFQGRWFVSFPPFPAVLLAPFVALCGGADRTPDGVLCIALSGAGPAILFLALERIAKVGRSRRSTNEDLALALLFAFGTVYWSTALQGTVWYAAHVVGVALTCLYLYASIGAANPILAGLALALAFASRPSLGYAFPLFLIEAYRAASATDAPADAKVAPRVGKADGATLLESLALFAAPVSLILCLLIWYNRARFHDPFEFGHRYLQIGWRGRIDKWGLFGYHYLARNLGIALAMLPFTGVPGVPFQINVHGLALWFTSPFYVWAFWPRRTSAFYWALAFTTLVASGPDLFYQNSGWIQFGYRFSNDFAPFLMAMIAVGGRRLSTPFWTAGAFAFVVNAFGALTFQRAQYARYYFLDGTQRVLYQPD